MIYQSCFRTLHLFMWQIYFLRMQPFCTTNKKVSRSARISADCHAWSSVILVFFIADAILPFMTAGGLGSSWLSLREECPALSVALLHDSPEHFRTMADVLKLLELAAFQSCRGPLVQRSGINAGDSFGKEIRSQFYRELRRVERG